MIVLHPSSRCDVCLNEYTWDAISNTPHAIACGHIFCLTCLQNVSPANCPLCRKTFQPDRVKKLHVDPPSEDVRVVDSESSVFLQRLAMVSGEESPDSQVADVLVEVEDWLSRQPEDPSSNRPLRAALAALRNYKALQEKSNRDRDEFQNRRRQYHDYKRNAEQELQTARAIEECLLAQIQNLEEDFKKKSEEAQAEIAALRLEVSRFRCTSNPLPPPPEPLSADRLLAFSRPTELSSESTNSGNQGVSTSNGASHRAPGTEGNGTRYANTFFAGPNFRPLTSDEQHDLARTHAGSSRELEEAAHPEGRQTPIAGPSRIPTAPPKPSRVPEKHPFGSNDVFHHHLSSDTNYSGYQALYKPGASPTKRVVPPVPQYRRDDPRGRPETESQQPRLESFEQDQGAMEGTSEMGRNGYSYWDEVANMDRSLIPRQRVPDSNGRRESVVDDTTLATTAAFISGYASGLDQGYVHGNDPDSGYEDDGEEEEYALQMRERAVGTLGLFGVPEPSESAPLSRGSADSQIHRPVPRRSATSISHLESRASVTTVNSLSMYAVPQSNNVHRVPGQHRAHEAYNLGPGAVRPESVSSWGTVHTGDVRDGRGSMSDLDLIGLPPPVPTGNDTPSASSQTTPLRAINRSDEGNDHDADTPVITERRLSLLGVTPRPGQSSALGLTLGSGVGNIAAPPQPERRAWVHTPRNDVEVGRSQRSGSNNIPSDPYHRERLPHREPSTIVRTSNGDERPRHSRSVSHPETQSYQQVPTEQSYRHQTRQLNQPESHSVNAPGDPFLNQRRHRTSSTVTPSAISATQVPLQPHRNGTYAPEVQYNPSSLMPSWGATGPYRRSQNMPINTNSRMQATAPQPNHVQSNVRVGAPIASVRSGYIPWSSG